MVIWIRLSLCKSGMSTLTCCLQVRLLCYEYTYDRGGGKCEARHQGKHVYNGRVLMLYLNRFCRCELWLPVRLCCVQEAGRGLSAENWLELDVGALYEREYIFPVLDFRGQRKEYLLSMGVDTSIQWQCDRLLV